MEDEDEQLATPGVVGHHLSKRSRRNKGVVVVFDPEARKEFVTGFQKRKKKRRKVAEKQKQVKEREKRLQERKERRLALKLAQGEPRATEGEEPVEDHNERIDLNEDELTQACTENGTVTYEGENTMTIVNTCGIDMNNDLFDNSHGKERVYQKPKSSKGGDKSATFASKKILSKTTLLQKRKFRASGKQQKTRPR